MAIANASTTPLASPAIGDKTILANLFPGLTAEARIQAAINYADLNSADYVYVPGDMLPYNAALITFGSARMISEGSNPRQVDVRSYGAAGNGTTDDTASIMAAIRAVPQQGGAVYFPGGTYRITSSLDAAINFERSIALTGETNAPTVRGGLFGVPIGQNPVVLYIKELSDYLITLANDANHPLQTFGLFNLDFDMSNGGGVAGASTTCPGVLATNGVNFHNIRIVNCATRDTAYAHVSGTGAETKNRAVFDLAGSVWTRIENCQMTSAINGRHIYSNAAGTTLRIADTYFQGAREIYYHRGGNQAATHIVYDSCVFESSVVVGAQYLVNVVQENCWYENIGEQNGSAHVTGLAPRNHGLTFGGGLLSGNVNTALNALYGHLILNQPYLNGLKASSPIDQWFECLGTGNTPGNGGGFVLRNGVKTNGEQLFTASMAFTAPERAGFPYFVQVEDSWGGSPVGIVFGGANQVSDMRKVNEGNAYVAFNDGSTRKALLYRGRLHYRIEESGEFTTTPGAGVFPTGGQHEIGDCIWFTTPTAGGFIGTTCTTAGNPGTWKTFGAITP